MLPEMLLGRLFVPLLLLLLLPLERLVLLLELLLLLLEVVMAPVHVLPCMRLLESQRASLSLQVTRVLLLPLVDPLLQLGGREALLLLVLLAPLALLLWKLVLLVQLQLLRTHHLFQGLAVTPFAVAAEAAVVPAHVADYVVVVVVVVVPAPVAACVVVAVVPAPASATVVPAVAAGVAGSAPMLS